MKTEYRAFTNEMIPEAGRLLAERHTNNRKNNPLLPVRFEDPQTATKAVESLWQKKLKNGFAAFHDGKLSAYLIGEQAVQPWGRYGSVYLPGYAMAEGEKTEVIQDLYALLGDEWVRKGIFSHGLYVSAADANIVEAFFDLGFGKERVDALMELGRMKVPDMEIPAGIEIRKAGKGDNELIGSFSDLIMRALSSAPYWHPTVPEDYEELREGWAELADDKEWTVWLALENNEALGMIGFRPEPEGDTQMLVQAGSTYLSVAVTRPSARGRGINTALTWHGLNQARKDGYELCFSNWISPNLLAARFWPRFGFKDAAYRMAKKIDPAIAWARAEQT